MRDRHFDGKRLRVPVDCLTFATEFCNVTEHQASGPLIVPSGAISRLIFATLKPALSGPSADVAKLTPYETQGAGLAPFFRPLCQDAAGATALTDRCV
jgi:hypothetical protein